MRREAIQRLAFRTVSQTGIHYREGPLSESTRAHGRRRAARGRSLSVAVAQVRARGARSRICSSDSTTLDSISSRSGSRRPPRMRSRLGRPGAHPRVARRYRERSDIGRREAFPQPSYYLLRPDGHIGLCGAAPRRSPRSGTTSRSAWALPRTAGAHDRRHGYRRGAAVALRARGRRARRVFGGRSPTTLRPGPTIPRRCSTRSPRGARFPPARRSRTSAREQAC